MCPKNRQKIQKTSKFAKFKKRTPVVGTLIVLVLIFIISILVRMYTLDTEVALVQTYAAPSLPVIADLTPGDYRQTAISVDGQILQGSGKAPQPTASTAKMILGLAVMKERPFNIGETGETIAITPEFYQKYLWYIQNNGSTTPVVTGEEISQYDALASVFLASSNNLADSLAIWAFGSLENYQKSATEMLENMGLKNTTVGTDASGYSATTTSTAEDLSIIAAKLLENPVLREIVGLKSHVVPVAGLLTNTNQILGTELADGASVTGVKTGYIGDISGYNLISAYEMDGHFVISALLGASTRAASFTESENILYRLSAELTPTVLVENGTSVGYLETWWNGRHDLIVTDEVKVLAPSSAQLSTNLSETNLTININGEEHHTAVIHEDFSPEPTFVERFLHLFGWASQ